MFIINLLNLNKPHHTHTPHILLYKELIQQKKKKQNRMEYLMDSDEIDRADIRIEIIPRILY